MKVTEFIRQKSSQFMSLKHLNTIKIFIVVAIITWIARFWYCNSFGLYEDDYGHFSHAMMLVEWSAVWKLILKRTLAEAEGRPLHFISIYLPVFLGFKLGGLQVVYWIGYFLVTCNSFLFYLLLNRLNSQPIFAVTGALAFCLFPADTTQAFLTHSLGLQTSLMFFLIASLFYFSKNWRLAYLFIFGSLTCYETPFTVFFAIPLLKDKWDSKLLRTIVRHTLILSSMIVLAIIIRKITGEGRIAELDVLSAIRTPIRQMIIGPIVTLIMFIYRPLQTLKALRGELLIFVPLCFAGLVCFLSRLKLDLSDNSLHLKTLVRNKILQLEMPEFFQPIAKRAIVGLIMLVLAYPLAFTVPATAISGRASRVHLAAIFGASILCASLCSAILFIASTYQKKRLATVSLAAFFALLLGFGLIVQQDYRVSWQYQRAFWNDVIRLCPDITDGTVILVEPKGLRNPAQIKAYSWSLPLVLKQIYRFPDDWKFTPNLYKLKAHWQEQIAFDGDLLKLNAKIVGWVRWPDRGRKLESSNVILLETKNGQLTRRTKTLRIGDREFSLKDASASRPQPFAKGWLYDYLIKSPEKNQKTN